MQQTKININKLGLIRNLMLPVAAISLVGSVLLPEIMIFIIFGLLATLVMAAATMLRWVLIALVEQTYDDAALNEE